MFDTLPVDKIGVTNTRLTNLEYLGTDMIEAGNEFGAGSPYGSALIRVGQTEQALGEIEKDYIKSSHSSFCGPLQGIIDFTPKQKKCANGILFGKDRIFNTFMHTLLHICVLIGLSK